MKRVYRNLLEEMDGAAMMGLLDSLLWAERTKSPQHLLTCVALQSLPHARGSALGQLRAEDRKPRWW